MNDNTATTVDPEQYIRINVTKNSKGYTYETTVSVRWHGQEGKGLVSELLADADAMARAEIARRENADRF